MTPLNGRSLCEINNILFTTGDVLIDANGEYASQLIVFKTVQTIKYFHVYFSVVGNAGDVMVSLKSINDTALPSVPNAILGAGNSAYGTATISAAGWYRIQLNTNYTTTVGEKCFLVVEHTNFQAGDSLTIGGSALRQTMSNLYKYNYLGGVGTATNGTICFALEDSVGVFLKYFVEWSGYITTLTVDNTTTPDEVGNVITLQRRHTIYGAEFVGDIDGAVNIVLYYAATSVSFSIVANRRLNANAGINRGLFATPYTADVNESYRLSILPTSATAGTFRDYTYPTGYEVAVKTALFGSDVSISKTTRKSAGAWTDDSTKVVGVVPIISQIDIGGTMLSMGMNGGVQ